MKLLGISQQFKISANLYEPPILFISLLVDRLSKNREEEEEEENEQH